MKIIITNLKMFLNTKEKIEKFEEDMKNYKAKFIVSPQNIYLEHFIKKDFTVAAQNTSDKIEGPYTGEISSKSLKNLGVDYVLIGHSEIREKYIEEDNKVKTKVENALKNNLKTVLCIGEKKQDEQINEIIDKQLKNISPNKNLIISYEPVWAIGGNKQIDKNKIEKAIKYIKCKGHKIVIYGGSVNEKNIEKLCSINLIDGFLIGSSALDTSKLKKIIEVAK